VDPEERAAYTWTMASRDLALVTPLTLTQAADWTAWGRALGVHPHDALPLLVQAVKALPDVNVGPGFFSAVAALVGNRG